MRELIFGLFIGIIVAKFPDWLRDYRMFADYPYAIFYFALLGLLLLILQYPIMRIIARLNPKFYLWLNKFFAPTKIDKEFCDRLAEWEKTHKKRGVK